MHDVETDYSALLNVIEVILNVEYLYLRHTSPRSERKSRSSVVRYHGHAPLVGFASALMTLAKTALYWLQGEYLTSLVDVADIQNGIADGVWSDITRQPSSGVCGRRRMGGSADGQLMCS
jgi:hypothetical protein